MRNEKIPPKAVPTGAMSEYTKRGKRHTLRRTLSYFKYFPWITAAALLLALISNLTTTLKPLIIEKIIDDNIEAGLNDFDLIVRWAAVYLVVVLVGVATAYLQTLALSSLGQRVMHRMRTTLFEKIQHMSMGFFDRNASGSILTRVSSDVESMSELFSDVFVSFVRDLLLIGNVIVLMFTLDVRLSLWSLLILPVILAIALVYRWLSRRNNIKLKGQLSKMNGFMAENVIGMKIVQLFGREKTKYAEYEGLTTRYYKLGMIDMLLRTFSNPLMQFIGNAAVALLLICFSGDVVSGALKIGVLYAFTSYIKQFISPVSRIAEQFTTIQSSLISADRVFDILDNDADCEDMKAGFVPEKVRGEIEFEHVWFAYDAENWVLKDVSFKVRPGETLAVVGNTGSGKTTLISLLARFYTVKKGRILLDGRDINEYNLSALRRAVSVVMQDVFLFSGDISYNIRLNEESIGDDEVENAIKTVCAADFVQALPEGSHSAVTERGSTFSAGERQLIAFARAVAFNAAILVLDEATANIDSRTEAALQSALAAASVGRTTIVIAHRISTIAGADDILVMADGVLAEEGRHVELLEKGGIYAKLCENSIIKDPGGTPEA